MKGRESQTTSNSGCGLIEIYTSQACVVVKPFFSNYLNLASPKNDVFMICCV